MAKLNIRNVNDWIIARDNHNKGEYTAKLCQMYKMSKEELHVKWRMDFKAHLIQVKSWFKTRPDQLLIYNIDEDSTEKILNFLKK